MAINLKKQNKQSQEEKEMVRNNVPNEETNLIEKKVINKRKSPLLDDIPSKKFKNSASNKIHKDDISSFEEDDMSSVSGYDSNLDTSMIVDISDESADESPNNCEHKMIIDFENVNL